MGNAENNNEDVGSYVDELKPGTKLLHGQYTIESFLNSGGFGITYLATNSLDRKVVIKECFPSSFCHRSRAIVQARSDAHTSELESIVNLFMQEARSLAKLDHPNIVGVHQVFEDNQTAYMVLDFVEGRDLLDTLEDPNHGLTTPQIQGILKDVLGAVQYIHERGILHRDISPDNILLDANMRPILIDFGAAREEASKQSRVLSALRVVKDGYSPQEFYIQGSPQSPSSDLYALGASFYHLIDGDLPPNSQARLAAIAADEPDTYVPLSDRVKGYDRKFLSAIDKALAILPKDRLQSAQEWIEMMSTTRRKSRAVTQVIPMSSAAAATAMAERKSRMIPLMGSAAALAFVAMGGLFLAGKVPLAGDDAKSVQSAELETEIRQPIPEVKVEAIAEEIDETPASEWNMAQINADLLKLNARQTILSAEANANVARAQAEAEASLALAQAEAEAEAQRQRSVVTTARLKAALEAEKALKAEAAEAKRQIELAEVALKAAEEKQLAARDVARAEAIAQTGPEAVSRALSQSVDTSVPQVGTLQGAVLQSNWSVAKPFTTEENSTRITAFAKDAPSWARVGTEIVAVNGTPVSNMLEFDNALRASVNPANAVSNAMTLTLKTGRNSAEVQQEWDSPIVQETQLSNGTTFSTQFGGEIWNTYVSAVSADETDLEVGDEIIAYMTTAEQMIERTTIKDIFARELERGTDEFSFAVSRGGSMWVASLVYNGGA